VDKTMAKTNGLPTCSLVSIALLAAVQGAGAVEPVKDIVVFDFEMMDSSAGSGIIPQDELDTKYLVESTQVARDSLQSTGAYKIVDTKPAATEIARAGALRSCDGCEAAIALKLGGELAMTGIVNRISRTEFEMLIKVVDTGTGTPVAVGYTGLRMGANHAWPRGARWLMERRVMVNLSDK
jgi:Protein of unknown function (DUF2380)